MATSFDDIEDLALIEIQDYRIDGLSNDIEAFHTYLDGFVVKAVPHFTNCLQSLSYDLDSREFDKDLSNTEQEILACYVVEMWLKQVTQDITQMNLHMTNKEFKVYSEAENLKQKSEHLDRTREKVKQLSVEYQLQNIGQISYFANLLK